MSAALGGDLTGMRDELDALGAAAALVLVGITLVHVVVPFPAEIPTAAAGFVLGFGVAFPLMVAAWTISCLAAYVLARVVGPPGAGPPGRQGADGAHGRADRPRRLARSC